MKKIVFSDIDRTLAIDGVISKKNKNLVKKYTSLGNKFILISGRTITYTTNISKNICASNYVICNNGSIIYDYNKDKIIYILKISLNALNKLYEISNENDCRMFFGGRKNIYTNKLKHQDEIIINNLKLIYDKEDVSQVTISGKNIDSIKKVIQEVEKIKEIKILNRHRKLYDNKFKGNNNIWIDIGPADANKGKAVIMLLKYLKIDIKDSVRIGDDLNDLPMFLDEGVNVAVSNAIPVLRQEADYVTSSCDNDGVAQVLEKIIANDI